MKPSSWRICALAIAAAMFALAAFAATAGDRRPSLDELLAQVPEIARGAGPGVSDEQQRLAKQIQGFGADAIPAMISRLNSPDQDVSAFAGYVLRDMAGLNETHLDALIAARKKGDGWIPPAIARVGTPRAIAFLIDDLKAHPETETQLTWALVESGNKAAPGLAALFHSPEPLSQPLRSAINSVLTEMGPKAKGAIAPLFAAAGDRQLNAENRVGAVIAIGSIGSAAAEMVPRLHELARAEPALFGHAVKAAIVGIGTADAVPIMIEQLKTWPREIVLRDIAALRENGRSAGPVVATLLSDPDWDVRVAAARTLGYIDYQAGGTVLRGALADPNDWRLVYVAAESLGRLHDRSAVLDLKKVEAAHWSPVVRQSAHKAVDVILGRDAYTSRWHPSNFPFEYFEYQNASFGPADDDGSGATAAKFENEPGVLTPEEREKIKCSFEIVGYDEKGRNSHPVMAVPSCAFRVPGGYLVGIDRGEWGGQLMFRSEEGKCEVLLGKNTHGIHRLPFGIVALTGLAHMFMNSGVIYRVTLEAGHAPTAKPWKQLPGAPRRSGKLKDGSLYVSCHGGDVIITPQGEIKAAPERAGEHP